MQQGALAVDVYSRDDQTKLSTGKLLTIDNQIDQSTGTARLKAVFENPDNSLWPNQFVNVHLLLETRKDAITMPVSAVQRGPQGTFVYLVDDKNTVQVRPVQLSLTQGNVAVVATGLQPGERVVTDGQEKLQAGSRVAPQGPANQSKNTLASEGGVPQS
jgi:multidrug efflux system membrane fusion protein